MARTWLSIRAELVSGHGGDLWPRPGRVFAAARSHSFAQLAKAIDVAFARWDLAHLHLFTLSDGTPVSPLDWWDGEAPDGTVDGHATKLSRLKTGEQFAYVFDMGDGWAHLCTVAERIDPVLTAWHALSHRPGPSITARRRATAKGWAPPLAWEDHTIDHPDHTPSGTRTPGQNQQWTPELLQHELEFLTRLGLGRAQALQRLSLNTTRARALLNPSTPTHPTLAA